MLLYIRTVFISRLGDGAVIWLMKCCGQERRIGRVKFRYIGGTGGIQQFINNLQTKTIGSAGPSSSVEIQELTPLQTKPPQLQDP